MPLRRHPLLRRLTPDDKGPIAPAHPGVLRKPREREGSSADFPGRYP